MIPVLAGDDAHEAQRLLAALHAAGIGADMVEQSADLNDAPVALVHLSRLKPARAAAAHTALIAFGGADRADVAVQTLKEGAAEYLPEGAGIDRLSALLRECAEPAGSFRGDSVAVSDAMQDLLSLAERVAAADIAVMVSGESGTGKEVICRHIHRMSPRADGPFIAVNCAAIPETMLEAVLFGHEKGAFTGAAERRLGKFELADRGTLLLDEITEMPVALQAKLLRVLQEREVERIGSSKPRAIDVRVLATSNRQLSSAVAEGKLREDLYYRLSVFPLQIPPLRDRKADIPALAQHFLHKYANGRPIELSPAATDQLMAHAWPGNVRELENCIQRAIVLCVNNRIDVPDLALTVSADTVSSGVDAEPASLQAQLRNSEEQLLIRKLNENGGVRKVTAQQLGISERTLRYKLKQLKDRGIVI